MCDTLSELRRDVSRYVGVFDADLLSAAQAAEAVEASTAIERMIGIVKAKAAARVSDTRGWKGAGERSAASHLARRTGSTVGQANGTLKTGQRLKDLPVLDAAARSGELSAQQTAAIAEPPPPTPPPTSAWSRRPRTSLSGGHCRGCRWVSASGLVKDPG